MIKKNKPDKGEIYSFYCDINLLMDWVIEISIDWYFFPYTDWKTMSSQIFTRALFKPDNKTDIDKETSQAETHHILSYRMFSGSRRESVLK